MGSKDQFNPNQNPQGRSGIGFRATMSLLAGMIVATTLGSSVFAVLTLIFLQQKGIVVVNIPSLSPPPLEQTPSPTPPTDNSTTPPKQNSTTLPSPISKTPDPKVSSIFNLQCQPAIPNSKINFVKNNEPQPITINNKRVPEIGFWANTPNNEFHNQESIVCNLDGKFQKLDLVFAIDGGASNAKQDISIQIDITRDGKLPETIKVTRDSIQKMSNINLQGVRDLGITVQCSGNYNRCPHLSIIEANLQ